MRVVKLKRLMVNRNIPDLLRPSQQSSGIFSNASLDLPFAERKVLTDAISGKNLITFTRTSSGTYVGSDGVLQRATTNLLLRSEDLTTTWTNFNSTEAADTAIAPNGTLTADTLIPNNGVTDGLIRQDVSGTLLSDNSAVSFSVYVKTAGLTNLAIQFYNKANTFHSSQTVNASTGGLSGSGTLTTTAVSAVGDGWYRVSLTGMTAGSGATTPNVRIIVTSTGNGTSGIYLWGAQLEQSSTVGEYIPTTSTINSAPRFDHNPTTGESLGLLVEEQRTNLALRSEQFDDASWTKGNASIIINSIAAPNGTLTGTKVIEDTANSTHFARRNTSSTINTSPLTFSVYVKAAERTNVGLAIQEATTFTRQANVNFDLATGTANAVSNIGGASASSTTITAVGNGWYRCTLTTTLGGTDANVLSWIYISTSGGFTYAGNGTSGIYIWGAQLEAGAFPTSYIPTTTAAATRSADVASITGTNFSSWYRQDEGTVFADATIANTGSNRFIVGASDATVNEEVALYWNTVFNSLVTDGAASQANSFGGTVTAGSRALHSFAYKANDFQGYGNAVALSADTSGTLPTADRLTIGSRVNSTFWTNGTIRRLTYWPARLANSTLQQITQ